MTGGGYGKQLDNMEAARVLDGIIGSSTWRARVRSLTAVFPRDDDGLPDTVAVREESIGSFGAEYSWFPIVCRRHHPVYMNVLENASLLELLRHPQVFPGDSNAALLIEVEDDAVGEDLLNKLAWGFPGQARCNWNHANQSVVSDIGRIASGTIVLNRWGTRELGLDGICEDKVAAAYLIALIAEELEIHPERLVSHANDRNQVLECLDGYALSAYQMSLGRVSFPLDEMREQLDGSDWEEMATLVRVLPDASSNSRVSQFREFFGQRRRYVRGWQAVLSYFGCHYPLGSPSLDTIGEPEIMFSTVESLELAGLLGDSRIPDPGDGLPNRAIGYAVARLSDINYFGEEHADTLSDEEVAACCGMEPRKFEEEKDFPIPYWASLRNSKLDLFLRRAELGIFEGGSSRRGIVFPTDEARSRDIILVIDDEMGDSSIKLRSFIACLLFLGVVPADGTRIAPVPASRLSGPALSELAALVDEGKLEVAYDPEGVFGEKVDPGLDGCILWEDGSAKLTDEGVAKFGREEIVPRSTVVAGIISRRFFQLVDGDRRASAGFRLGKDMIIDSDYFNALTMGRSRFCGEGFPVDGAMRLFRTADREVACMDGLYAGEREQLEAFADEFFEVSRLWLGIVGWVPELRGQPGCGFIREMAHLSGLEPYLAACCSGISSEDLL